MILHLQWRDGSLYAWGEQVAGKRRGASSCSPFDPGEKTLRATLAQLMQGVDVPDAKAVTLSMPFPTVRHGKKKYPLPSQDFLMGVAHGVPAVQASRGRDALPFEHDGNVVFEPWDVTAIEIPWRSMFTLLCLITERELAEGVFAAEEAVTLAALFRYTGALVARGRYLPGLRKTSAGEYEAVWSPCIDGEEDGRIRQFAERLPWVAVGASGIIRQDLQDFTDCQDVAKSNGHEESLGGGTLELSNSRTLELPPPPSAVRAVEEMLGEWLDRLVRASVTTTLSRAYATRGQKHSVHDAWFAALRGEARVIRWPQAEELDALIGQVNEWRHPVTGTRNRDERPAFILRVPGGQQELGIRGDTWFLEIAFPGKDLSRLSEDSLLSLGQAAWLFPPVGQAEVSAEGFGCRLEVPEAYAFLMSSHALLSAAGYAVTLPPDWSPDTCAGIALTADVAPHDGQQAGGVSAFSADARVDVRLSVTFDGEPVTPEELEALLATDSPLVFFRGRWLVADVRQLQSALLVGKRKGAAETGSALDAVRLALGTGDRRHGLPVTALHGHGWVRDLFNRLSGDEHAFALLPPPPDFVGELRTYQLRGFSWLVYLRECGFGACLADDMGLGKTIQALAFLLREKTRNAGRPALIVGPMSVLGNWMREAQRFAPGLRCHLHHGALRWHGESFAREMREMDVVVTSYNLLYRDYAELRQVSWSGILLDEAQNIKNPETRQAQAARALNADYRIALTGTPIENHVGDLWSIMDFLNPGILGKRATFRNTFFRPIQSGTDPGARTRLRRITTPFILRRLKTDRQIISDLPEKMEAKVYCPLALEQVRLYQDELAAFQRELENAEGIGRRGLILATLTRLKQICNHPANYLKQPLGDVAGEAKRSGKLMRLKEQLDEVFACGECALVFTQYAEMGHLLTGYLCQAFGRDMPYLHGGIPRPARDAMVRAFQETVTPQAFVLSLKAGGLGLNLTRATHVFHYDRWWNPAVENQATDRAFRIGQTRRVMVYKFICGGTLEDRIDAMIESKTALAAEIISHGEHFLTELSNDNLTQLLKLEADYLAE